MPKIMQLSTHVANLIAAGEVVERPASVVKELVENSIDAGARSITVEIQNGGMTLLRVQDDGCGMTPEDAETAFLRHATSKIREKRDLEAIGTLGFRGEALAATAAVSRIDLLTRSAECENGVRLHLEAGKVLEREPAGCPVGTTILVRDLFYNTPARMKFMKSDKSEAGAVLAAVQKQALAHPECAIRMISDGEEKLRSAGDGQLRSAIYTVLGRQSALEMLPVESQWEKVRISGFVSKPTATRGSRSYEIFFVNGRFVKSKTMSAALEEAYRNQMMVGRFPACVLNLELPLGAVDVNVHPAKTEVKFLNEREIFDCIHYGVLAALNRQSGRVELQFRDQGSEEAFPSGGRWHPASPASRVTDEGLPPSHPNQAAPADHIAAADRVVAADHSGQPAKGKLSSNSRPEAFREMDLESYRAFLTTLGEASKVTPGKAVQEQLFSQKPVLHSDVLLPADNPKPCHSERSEESFPPYPGMDSSSQAPVGAILGLPETGKDSSSQAPQNDSGEQTELPMETVSYRLVGEVLDTYIIVEQDGAVLFIDKHAAHERINFERLMAQGMQVTGQLLLAPLTVELDPDEAAALMREKTLLDSLGYDFDSLGSGTLLLRQIPADLPEADAMASLSEIASHLQKGVKDSPESLRAQLLHTIACKAAIKGGWTTSEEERAYLVRQVLTRDDLKYCPHGRPIVVTLSQKQLEKQFKRIV